MNLMNKKIVLATFAIVCLFIFGLSLWFFDGLPLPPSACFNRQVVGQGGSGDIPSEYIIAEATILDLKLNGNSVKKDCENNFSIDHSLFCPPDTAFIRIDKINYPCPNSRQHLDSLKVGDYFNVNFEFARPTKIIASKIPTENEIILQDGVTVIFALEKWLNGTTKNDIEYGIKLNLVDNQLILPGINKNSRIKFLTYGTRLSQIPYILYYETIN